MSDEQEVIDGNMETLEKLGTIERILYRKSVPEERLRLIRAVVDDLTLIDQPISQGLVDKLTQDACFAADIVAISNRHTDMTNAEQTRAIIRRAIEFMIGNDVVRVVDHGDEGRWMTINPPYDEKFLAPNTI